MFGKILLKLGIKKRQSRENVYGYIFILPWIIGMLVFTLGPMVFSFITSFADYNMIKIDFIGPGNYLHMLTRDQLFWKSLKNTAVYAVMNIPLVTAGGVIVAVILNKSIFGLRTFRTIFYLPSIKIFFWQTPQL